MTKTKMESGQAATAPTTPISDDVKGSKIANSAGAALATFADIGSQPISGVLVDYVENDEKPSGVARGGDPDPSGVMVLSSGAVRPDEEASKTTADALTSHGAVNNDCDTVGQASPCDTAVPASGDDNDADTTDILNDDACTGVSNFGAVGGAAAGGGAADGDCEGSGAPAPVTEAIPVAADGPTFGDGTTDDVAAVDSTAVQDGGFVDPAHGHLIPQVRKSGDGDQVLTVFPTLADFSRCPQLFASGDDPLILSVFFCTSCVHASF